MTELEASLRSRFGSVWILEALRTAASASSDSESRLTAEKHNPTVHAVKGPALTEMLADKY